MSEVSGYLGKPGRLVPIYSTPGMPTEGIPARYYDTTLEGRVKAQIALVGRRSWDLDAQAAGPAELSALMGFAAGEWGIGPFIWISPSAPYANLLMPEQSFSDPDIQTNPLITEGGPLDLGGGVYAGRSYANTTPLVQLIYPGLDLVPVIPKKPVTASSWVIGAGARVRLYFYDSAGNYITAITSTNTATAGTATRCWATATAPDNAALAHVVGVNAVRMARSAITWTDAPMPWQPGEGCPRSLVDAVGREVNYVSANLRGRRDSNLQYRIREVG